MRFGAVLLSFSTFWLASVPAFATPKYAFNFELGVGASQIREGSAAFGSGAATPLGYGFAMHESLFLDLMTDGDRMHFHVGLQHRTNTGSRETAGYGLQAVYPAVRIEVAPFYVSGGITPLVWLRSGDGFGFTGYERNSGASAGMVEAGAQIPVIPKFYIAGSLGAQVARIGGQMGPRPSIDLTFVMRFYFGRKKENDADSTREDYGGWRYPFGIERDR